MEESRPETVTYRMARRIAVAIVGATLLVIGAILLVTPGPAVVVLTLGLAVLAAEFAWARRWLRKLRAVADGVVKRVRGGADEERDG
jgi:tellurite resistance protein TerC